MIAIISVLVLVSLILVFLVVDTKRRLNINEMILDFSLELSSTVERRKLLELIMTRAANSLNAEAASIILMDQESGDLYFEVATGDDADHVSRIRIPAGQGVAGWVQINGQSVVINDVTKDSRWSSTVSDSSKLKTRNMLCVPILSNGALLGVLQVINKFNHKNFTHTELHLLEQLSSPIAMSLENMMLYEALKNSMNSLQETTATKEKMLSEMRLAKEIQESLLPGHSFSHHNVSIEALLVPAREVGGDFYHFFELDAEHILVCLGDVSDKGMPAALFMSALMIWIKAKASSDISVEQILYEINQELSTDTSTMFATLFIAVINTKTGKIQFCDAGHCNAYIANSILIKTLGSHKDLPIGVMPNIPFQLNTYELSAGDQLILYTDGITEAENKLGEFFGEKRFEQYLNEHRGDIQVKSIVDNIKIFSDNLQTDDIAVMKITYNKY